MVYRSAPPTPPVAMDPDKSQGPPTVLKFGSNVTPHISSLRPHPKYYFPDGSLTFLVQSTIFRVHRYFFERESEFVRDILKKRPYSGGQDDTVIPLTECTCEDLEALLWVFYNERYDDYTASKDMWKSILSLSVQLKMPNILSLVKRSVPPLLADPIEHIQLQVKYDIEPEWAIGGYVKLVQRHDPFSLDEARRLGLECMVIIQKAKFITSALRKDATLNTVVRSCVQEVYGTGPAEGFWATSGAMATARFETGTVGEPSALLLEEFLAPARSLSKALSIAGSQAPTRVGTITEAPAEPIMPVSTIESMPSLEGEPSATPDGMPISMPSPRAPESPAIPESTPVWSPRPEVQDDADSTTLKKKVEGAVGSAVAIPQVPSPEPPQTVELSLRILAEPSPPQVILNNVPPLSKQITDSKTKTTTSSIKSTLPSNMGSFVGPKAESPGGSWMPRKSDWGWGVTAAEESKAEVSATAVAEAKAANDAMPAEEARLVEGARPAAEAETKAKAEEKAAEAKAKVEEEPRANSKVPEPTPIVASGRPKFQFSDRLAKLKAEKPKVAINDQPQNAASAATPAIPPVEFDAPTPIQLKNLNKNNGPSSLAAESADDGRTGLEDKMGITASAAKKKSKKK